MSALSVNGLSFSGLASGVDTNSIITSILAVQKQQVTNLQNQITQIGTVQTAFQGIGTDLTDLQTKAQALSDPVNNVFNALSATPSDPSALNTQITQDNQQYNDGEQSLLKQFAQMEATISRLKQEGVLIASAFSSSGSSASSSSSAASSIGSSGSGSSGSSSSSGSGSSGSGG